ncbi:hypothetical protein HYALB_00005399 [Hymenoscyphus albidus]|uniref:VanZ-like domain-containing protein n=1 Tax=Hymenoscyphus albidus TaxID=595503 RepID=A0A9N9PYB5_9HELO|nr:hypothetical protein HYALB_00005399 [Hymenoscyphus albidus]
MRIRLPFAGAFLFFVLAAAYGGLSSFQLTSFPIDDKVLHTLTFFILTTCFYWILDTSRRRTLNLTLITCTGILGVGSEFLQGFLPNGRVFDLFDIVANILGSLGALALSSWYHTRMLDRKRLRKTYQVVPGDEERDLELGEGLGVGAQESGTTAGGGGASVTGSLEREVENWDENAVDNWEEEDQHTGTDEGDGPKTPSASSAGEAEEAKKRGD